MSSKPNNLPSFTQNLRPREKKMTMAEATVMLADFFMNCARKKRKDRTGGEYTLKMSDDYIKAALKKGKGTKTGTWVNLVQNAREIANSICFYLEEREKIELEEFFSYIFKLNGAKGISEFGENFRSGQCKYCWRYTTLEGKGKWLSCRKHSQGSRDSEIRKIMRLKDDIQAIRAKVHHYIYVDYETLNVSVNSDVCTHLAKLIEYRQCTLQEMFKLLDFDIGVKEKEVEIFELMWAMASFEAWHQAHARAATDIQETDQDAIVEITDEIWEKINKPVSTPPF